MRKRIGAWFAAVIIIVVGLGGVGLTPGTAQAAPIKVTLACPAVISPGGMLNVNLTMQNISSPPATVTVAKSAVAAHLANLDIIGPFVIPLARTLSPGAMVTVTGYLAVPFPSAPRGTFSSLGVMVMDSANEELGGSGCIIEVQ